MSCYEWENGRIKFSTAEYGKAKKGFIQVLKDQQETAFKNAGRLHGKMLEYSKGMRNIDWKSVYSECHIEKRTHSGRWGGAISWVDLDSEGTFYNTAFKECNTKKPLQPKKKDYFTKIDRKNPGFEHDDFNISFNDSIKYVCWSVEENNHACERAREHEVSGAFFRLLNNAKWTRNTGGVIVGNNKYNRDNCDVGGGENTINDRYGPLGRDD